MVAVAVVEEGEEEVVAEEGGSELEVPAVAVAVAGAATVVEKKQLELSMFHLRPQRSAYSTPTILPPSRCTSYY